MLAAVVAAALVVVDLVARNATEAGLSSAVQRSTHARAVTVSIHSFPFLYDLAADGSLQRVDFVGTGVPAGPIRLDRVELDAYSVHLDRNQLLHHHRVRVTAVDRATLTVSTRLSSLVSALAARFDVQVVQAGPGRLAITAAGHTITTVDLTRVPLIPECPLQVAHNGDTYSFSCTVSPVPASVIAALSKAHALHPSGGS